MSKPYPDRLLVVTLYATTLTFILAWLPLVRSMMDGETYRWGNSLFGHGFSGSGIGGDLWYLFAQTAIGIAIVGLGTRSRPAAPFIGLLFGWIILLLSSALYQSLTTAHDIRFRDDTLGIDVSVKWLAPIAYSLLLGLASFWYARRQRNTRPDHEQRVTRPVLLYVLLGLLPFQFLLLRFGVPHGTTDQVGVILTISQWVLLPWALWRYGPFSLRLTDEKESLSTYRPAGQ